MISALVEAEDAVQTWPAVMGTTFRAPSPFYLTRPTRSSNPDAVARAHRETKRTRRRRCLEIQQRAAGFEANAGQRIGQAERRVDVEALGLFCRLGGRQDHLLEHRDG